MSVELSKGEDRSRGYIVLWKNEHSIPSPTKREYEMEISPDVLHPRGEEVYGSYSKLQFDDLEVAISTFDRYLHSLMGMGYTYVKLVPRIMSKTV